MKLFKWNYELAANPVMPFSINVPRKITDKHISMLKNWASVGASVGEIFVPVVKKWKYIEHKKGVYPYQPACDLFRLGLVPSFDDTLWRLHSKNGIEWEGTV